MNMNINITMNKYLCMYKWHHDHRFVPEHAVKKRSIKMVFLHELT